MAKNRTVKKVQVWVLWGGSASLKVLLLRTLSSRGGFWQPVTGSIDSGETLKGAALREAREETGLTFSGKPSPLKGSSGSFVYEKNGVRYQEAVFFIFASSDEIVEAKAVPKEKRRGKQLGENQPMVSRKRALPVVQVDSREHDQAQWMSPQVALKKLKYPQNAQALQAILALLESRK